MAGNEEHPFASIVAAYHESQAPALEKEILDAVAESSAVEAPPAVEPTTPSAEALEEPIQAESTEPAATEPEAAAEPEPEAPADEPASVATEPEPVTPGVEPAADVPAAASVEAPPEVVASQTPDVDVPDSEKPSALVDPFKSILAAYYAQSIDPAAPGTPAAPQPATDVEPAAPEAVEPPAADSDQDVPEAAAPAPAELVEPEPVAAEAAPAVEPAIEPVVAYEAEPQPTEPEPVTLADEQLPTEAAEVDASVEPADDVHDEPEPVEPEALEPVASEHASAPASEDATDTESAAAPAWGRHAIPPEATGAAASVLAAYYADAPDPLTGSPAAAVTETPTVDEPVVETPVDVEPVTAHDATAVLPAVAAEGFPESPSNPLGGRPATGTWGAEALAAAGSTAPTEPVAEAKLPVTPLTRAADDVDRTIEPKADRSDARRKFLMLLPVALIAAIAVVAVLLWNGHQSTSSKPTQSPSTAPTLVLEGSPLKRTQEAYGSVLNRFNNANDAGGAVVAGGAARDTLKLLKDFKGATASDKALLAAERAHLTSLSGLASASAGGFADAANRAKSTLSAVQKAAAADATAKAPNSAPATTQAIDLLGEGNVTKMQVALNGLIGRADSATLTSQLRSVASEASANADTSRSLASVIKNPSVKTTATSLAAKFSSMAPMIRITGDTLTAWSGIRPGMVSAMGLDPVSHIDTLIASAQQKIAAWTANQGNNATVAAINSYANAMRSHFGAFSGALSQIPSLSSGETGAAGAKSGAQNQAANAAVAVNNAAFGGSPPPSLVAAHNALVDAINTGTRAATAAYNVTAGCTSSTCTYGHQSAWGTYSGSIWIKGGWSSKVGAWEAAVSAALKQAASSGTKPVV